MSSVAHVAIHPSQFPEDVASDLLRSLRARAVNHKFHYDTIKQTRQWLALHQACSPSRNDAECAAMYDTACAAAIAALPAGPAHLIGLGCGGGQKDARCLRQLLTDGRAVTYTACDVGVPMVLVARAAVRMAAPGARCQPFVCDLATADDVPEHFATHAPPEAIRLLTFFGMIPNFEPAEILPRLAAIIRPGDTLLVSANLAPGADYAEDMRIILPQYDNELTCDWLLMFLLDLGVDRSDGELAFTVEAGGLGLLRVVARFVFRRARAVVVEGETFEFAAGESIRLFFSYRYTPARVASALGLHGLEVADQWVAKSGEEGVFLVRRPRQ